MGKVWPPDSVAYNRRRRAQQHLALDESPLLEGLIYAGTDDGLLQVTEDGGKNWRKAEPFPGVPRIHLRDRRSRRRATPNTVFVTLNNWQRGDYKPYVMKSTDRGRTWTTIAGDLPARPASGRSSRTRQRATCCSPAWSSACSSRVDGGEHWVQLKGGMPDDPGARHRDPEARERSRGRHVRPRLLHPRRLHRAARADAAGARRAARSSSRCATPTSTTSWTGRSGMGRHATPNPPYGALFTYSVGQPAPAGSSKLALTIRTSRGQAGPPHRRFPASGTPSRGLGSAR